MPATPTVLITCAQMQMELPRHTARIEGAGYLVRARRPDGQRFTSRQLVPMMSEVVGVIAGDDQLDRTFFEGSENLRVLVRWGIGMDSVDHVAARERGVVVRNTPGVFGREVADAALGYLLALARGSVAVDRAVRAGSWQKYEGVTLHGQRVGIVGAGVIGQEIQRRAAAFGCETVFSDPFADERVLPAPLLPVDELIATSRFIVLACPLTSTTYHLIDAERLAAMRSDAYLINVARGPVVDEPALIGALHSGRLAGAALDVFETEPLPASSTLRDLHTVILGAHNGSNTRQGVQRASAQAVETLLEELAR